MTDGPFDVDGPPAEADDDLDAVDGEQRPNLQALADDLADKRVIWEAADNLAKTHRQQYEDAQTRLFDALEAGGLRAVRTARGLFSINDLPWAQVVDPERARLWADQNMPDLLGLNHARLSKIIRDALKGDVTIDGGVPHDNPMGVSMPPGVDYTTSRKITWRRT